jgi:O-antigen ligase
MVLSSRGLSVGRRVLLASSIVALVVGAVVFGVATGLFGGLLWERILELQEKGLSEGQREAIWITALKMGFAHPLTGVGIGNIRVEMLMAGAPVKVAHNDFLNHFAETGFLGLALYLAFLAAVVRSAWRTVDPWLRAGLLGLITAAMLGTVGNPSYGEKCFWLQMGLCLLGGIVFGPGTGATSTSPSADWPAPAALGPDLMRRPPWGRR